MFLTCLFFVYMCEILNVNAEFEVGVIVIDYDSIVLAQQQ